MKQCTWSPVMECKWGPEKECKWEPVMECKWGPVKECKLGPDILLAVSCHNIAAHPPTSVSSHTIPN